MPLTFIDIEKQKTWRIGIFFTVLVLLYFLIFLVLSLPFLPAGISMRFILAIVSIAILVAGIHFWFSASNTVQDVIKGLNAQPPDPKDSVHTTLKNIIDELHVVTGNTRRITCMVIPSLSMNALAVVDMKNNAMIAITEGLLSRLNRSQLEAVIAHEAHHILSGDCLITSVAASMFGTLSALVEKTTQTPRGTSFPHPALALASLLLAMSNLLNMFISREREYRADAASVRMTRNPVALAEALHLLSGKWRGAGFIGSGYQMLCIVNPEATLLDETEGFWADMISTHPPIRKRIEILLCMAHTDFSTLNGSRKSERSKSDSLISACYALDPRHQWQGPFALSELAALPWLSPLTWVRMNSDQPIARAWENPFINQIFIAKLSQKQTVTGCNCPACHLPLMQESYKGTQIRQCRFCAGVLVDTDKIPRILARTTVDEPCMARMHSLAKTVMHENQLAQTRQKLTRPVKNSILLVLCPQCGNPMYRGFYSGVYLIEIDRCSMCGITWFDQDELMMLQSLIEIKRDNEKILQ